MDNDLRRQGEGDWEAFERGVDAALASAPKPRLERLQTFDDVAKALGLLLQNGKAPTQTISDVIDVLSLPHKLFVVDLRCAAADRANDFGVALKPSKLFLDLLGAIRARKYDLVSVIRHQAFS